MEQRARLHEVYVGRDQRNVEIVAHRLAGMAWLLRVDVFVLAALGVVDRLQIQKVVEKPARLACRPDVETVPRNVLVLAWISTLSRHDLVEPSLCTLFGPDSFADLCARSIASCPAVVVDTVPNRHVHRNAVELRPPRQLRVAHVVRNQMIVAPLLHQVQKRASNPPGVVVVLRVVMQKVKVRRLAANLHLSKVPFPGRDVEKRLANEPQVVRQVGLKEVVQNDCVKDRPVVLPEPPQDRHVVAKVVVELRYLRGQQLDGNALDLRPLLSIPSESVALCRFVPLANRERDTKVVLLARKAQHRQRCRPCRLRGRLNVDGNRTAFSDPTVDPRLSVHQLGVDVIYMRRD